MGVRGLQSYILAKCPDSLVPVELSASKNSDQKKRLIVVEGWSCLRSVYGPHMDFICGGQWQEFRASIRRFVNTFQQVGCELVVFFSGGIEDNMRGEWARRRSQARDTVNMVMQGLRQRGHPPDRKHFLPNETHPQVFRQVLLSCHVKVISTPYSTDKAMVEYAHQHKAYGVLANDSDFIMMNAPRYLSLHHLRLSGNTISTVIVDRAVISETLDLPLSLFPLLSCLLGNDVVNYEVLEHFHKRLLSGVELDEEKKKEGVQLVMAVTDFVKALPDEVKTDVNANIRAIVKEVVPESEDVERWEALFLCGLEQYKEEVGTEPAPEPAPTTVVTVTIAEKEKPKPKESEVAGESSEEVSKAEGVEEGEEETVEEAKIIEDDVLEEEAEESEGDTKQITNYLENMDLNKDAEEAGEEVISSTEKSPEPKLITVPAVTSKVLQSARAAHVGGTLNTHLFPLMCSGTFSLGPIYEDVKDKDVASSAILFRAARQRIYGLVFGVGRGWVKGDSKRQRSPKIDTQRQVSIKEYIVNGAKKQIVEPEEVAAIPVHATSPKQTPRKPTPHMDRLWIGMSAKIQELRRNTFLAIMNCNIPSLCNPNVVANEYLLIAVVLRYILTSGTRVLREYELDAFLATALSPQLHLGPSHLYKISPGTRLTSRGCSLAHMVVRGVETVLLANDACAYPLPLRYCFIGNFFDGKLFQVKLAQTRAGMSLLDVCDGELYAVDYLRHLRCVITEELPRSVFASPPPGPMMQGNMRSGSRMMRAPQPPRPPYNDHRPYHNNQGGRVPGLHRHPPPNMHHGGQYRPQYAPPHPAMHQQPPPPPMYNNPPPPHLQPNYKQHNNYNNSNGSGNRRYNNNNNNNNYESHENYSDNNYHNSYNNNYNNNYNNHHSQNYNNNTSNGNYMPYKGHDNNYAAQQNGGNYYRGEGGAQNAGAYQGGYARSAPQLPDQQRPYNSGYNKINYKDNDPYGKRSVPDRSDTKRWIEFLGN